MSLYNFLLFHLRRHVKNLGFVLNHGFQTWPTAHVFIRIVSWCLEPLMKHFLGVCEVASFFSIKQFLLYSGADDFSATLDPQELLLLYVFILKVFIK